MSTVELCGEARASNQALLELAQKAQWQHSYVAANKTYCVYLADSEGVMKKQGQLSGFSANVITEAITVIDPLTANN
jgi:hypothetical protein